MLVHTIFVYGTLKTEQCRVGCWPYAPEQIQAASVRGRLFDLGMYPAMICDRHFDLAARVAGEVWSFKEKLMRQTLQALDLIEDCHGASGDLYHREIVECELDEDSTLLQAYTYVYARRHELDPATQILPSADGKCYWPQEIANI